MIKLNNIIGVLFILLLFVSIRPWKPQKSITPKTLINPNYYSFKNIIANEGSHDDVILLITEEKQFDNEFFKFSYVFYPNRLYWTTPHEKGPISWWIQNNLSQQSLASLIRGKKVSWIITYDLKIDNLSSNITKVTTAPLLSLYKVTRVE